MLVARVLHSITKRVILELRFSSTYFQLPWFCHKFLVWCKTIALRDYCQEEMWVWVFPHHKWQKNLSKSRGEAEWFGRNFLLRVVRKNSYSHFWSDSNHIVEITNNSQKLAETIKIIFSNYFYFLHFAYFLSNWSNQYAFFLFFVFFEFFLSN